MRTLLMTLMAASLALGVAGSANAMMMKHHHWKHHGMACKGEFMFMDMKKHKCMDATKT